MKKYDKWFTLFGGWFGLHRYASGEIKTGLLYTFTAGIFFIGWICDIITLFTPADAIWRRWSDVSGEGTDTRKNRAMNGELTSIRILPESKKAVFSGSEGGKYHTTLKKCTCPDFQKRNVPCKHMYYLAHKCGIDIYK